jgi:hypothetical protein
MSDARPIDRPSPGYWMVTLRRGGVPVPACIRWVQTTHEPEFPENLMERSRFLIAEINGEPVDMASVWERRGRPITEAEYLFQIADHAWAREHSPYDPKADPTKPVDFNDMPVIF